MFTDVVLDRRVAALEPVLITQPFKNALGSMSLLAVPAEILLQPLINEPCETIQFGSLDTGRPLISRRDPKNTSSSSRLHAISRNEEQQPVRSYPRGAQGAPSYKVPS